MTATRRAGRSSTGPTPGPRPATSRTAPGTTADMSHPTRTGDLVAFSYPPYQFDAETPGTLIAPSHFFGQHGYVPDVQDIGHSINMRATFLAGGEGIRKGSVSARSIDLAPTLAYLLGIPEPQHSQGKVLLSSLKGGSGVKPISIVGLNDFHGQLDPTTTLDRRRERQRRRRRPAGDDVRRGRWRTSRARALMLAGGDNVGASPPNSACSRTSRPSTWRTPGAWTRRPTATTSSTTALPGSSHSRTRPTSRSWPPTSSRPRPARPRTGSRPRWCSTSTASRSASSAPSSRTHPELVSAGTRPG